MIEPKVMESDDGWALIKRFIMTKMWIIHLFSLMSWTKIMTFSKGNTERIE